jgi:hypothetical protein
MYLTESDINIAILPLIPANLYPANGKFAYPDYIKDHDEEYVGLGWFDYEAAKIICGPKNYNHDKGRYLPLRQGQDGGIFNEVTRLCFAGPSVNLKSNEPVSVFLTISYGKNNDGLLQRDIDVIVDRLKEVSPQLQMRSFMRTIETDFATSLVAHDPERMSQVLLKAAKSSPLSFAHLVQAALTANEKLVGAA